VRIVLVLPVACLFTAAPSVALSADIPEGERVRCRDTPGDGSYWSWREINGRRCWYRGNAGKPKAELYWGEAPLARPVTPVMPLEPPLPRPRPLVPPEGEGDFDKAWRDLMLDLGRDP